MPALPPQSPALVGDEPAAAPRISMSLKSQSWADKVPTVRSRCVPRVSERKKTRRTAVAPATVRVPVIVLLAANVHCINPAVAGAVIVKLANVFAPAIATVFADVLVKLTLLNVIPPPLKLGPPAEQFI